MTSLHRFFFLLFFEPHSSITSPSELEKFTLIFEGPELGDMMDVCNLTGVLIEDWELGVREGGLVKLTCISSASKIKLGIKNDTHPQ